MKRSTKQRADVLDALDGSRRFQTAQELHGHLKTKGSAVGLTTVYRHLQELTEAGLIDSVVGERGEAMYRKCRREGHHHHLVCTRCKTSVEVGSETLETWASVTAKKHGFTEVAHVAELFGLCAACSSGGHR